MAPVLVLLSEPAGQQLVFGPHPLGHEARNPAYPLKTPRVIFRNLGGCRLEELLGEAGPALAEPHCSRGCVFGDFRQRR